MELCIRKPQWWDEAVEFFSNDEVLAPIVKQYQGGSLEGKGDLFATFVNSIVGQQISVIAAESIWNRLNEMVGEITPHKFLVLLTLKSQAADLANPKRLTSLESHKP